jgi:hypothetical protein
VTVHLDDDAGNPLLRDKQGRGKRLGTLTRRVSLDMIADSVLPFVFFADNDSKVLFQQTLGSIERPVEGGIKARMAL